MAILVKLLGCAPTPSRCDVCDTTYTTCVTDADALEWGCWARYCICLLDRGCVPCEELPNDR